MKTDEGGRTEGRGRGGAAGRRGRRAAAATALGLATALLGAPTPAAPQEAAAAVAAPDSTELVDRVVAVVGDTAVLHTEVLERLLQLGAQGARIPPRDTPAYDSLYRETLDGLVDEAILLQRAEESEIAITPEVLDREADRRFREIRSQFGSAANFQDAVARSGRNLVQYRQWLRAQVRGQMLIDEFIRQNRDNLPPVSVSEEEIREFFEANLQDRTRPASITVEQIVIEAEPDSAAEDSARAVAETALREIREGTEFAVAARRYSEDPSNREQGGDLGWVRRSQLVPAFAQAAWSARTGEPVGPVRSPFGWHVIQVENVRGGERKIRHILVRPRITAEDAERARAEAAAVADSIRQGADLRDLAERHGVEDVPVRIPEVPLDELEQRLGPSYAAALSSPRPGEVVGPFSSEGLVPGVPAFSIVRVAEFNARGDYELDDVREEIRQRILFDKGYRRFLEELRDQVYVDVRV